MDWQDLFVGSVTICLGGAAIVVAAVNWEAAYRLRVARSVQQQFGRPGARWFYAVIGLVLIGLGAAIITGLRPNAHSNPPASWRPTEQPASADLA